MLKAITPASLFICLWGCFCSVIGYAQPDNDNFVNRLRIELPLHGEPALRGYSLDATTEPGEPTGLGSASVWYAWRAPQDGALSASTVKRIIGVFEGTALANLKPVENLDVKEGREYVIGAWVREGVSASSVPPEFDLEVWLLPRPENDSFVNSISFTGQPMRFSYYTRSASPDPGETLEPGQGSLWWHFVAPKDGVVTIRGAGDSRILKVYQGTGIGSFTEVAISGFAYLRYFKAEAGKRYDIAFYVPGHYGVYLEGTLTFNDWEIKGITAGEVLQYPNKVQLEVAHSRNDLRAGTLLVNGEDHAWEVGGQTTLKPSQTNAVIILRDEDGFEYFSKEIEFSVETPNDHFRNQITITNAQSGYLTAFLSPSTLEVGEPPVDAQSTGSTWWRYDAPGDGEAIFNSYHIPLDVFEGNALGDLKLVAVRKQNEQTFIPVRKGRSYSLRFGNVSNQTYAFLEYRMAFAPPANDNFANRSQLLGNVSAEYYLLNSATREAFEDSNYPHTIWYTRTLTAPGISTIGVGGDRVEYAIFIGSPPSLQRLTRTRETRPHLLLAGTYHLQIRGEGIGPLSWHYDPGTLNDHFQSPIRLEGLEGKVGMTNYFATLQGGEPPPQSPGIGKTLWYIWTAPSDGILQLELEYGTVQVYSGESLATLAAASMSSFSDFRSEAIVRAGRTYKIRVDGEYEAYGEQLSYRFYEKPPNDDIEQAIALPPEGGEFLVLRAGCTVNPSDLPYYEEQRRVPLIETVWYEWNSTAESYARLSGSQEIVVAEGSPGNLASVEVTVHPDGSTGFRAEADKVYYFMLGERRVSALGYRRVVNLDVTSIKLVSAPENGVWIGDEPPALTATLNPAVDGHLVALRYYLDGFSTSLGAGFAPEFALTNALLKEGIHSIVAVGTNHLGKRRTSAPLRFRWQPKNDNFENRTQLFGYEPSAPLVYAGATVEPGDPVIKSGSRPSSIWYSWTVPADGVARLLNGGITVYQGSTLEDLVPVSFGPVRAGEVYHFLGAFGSPQPGISIPFKIVLPTGSQAAGPVMFPEGSRVPFSVTMSEDPAIIDRIEFITGENEILAVVNTPPYDVSPNINKQGSFSVVPRVIYKNGLVQHLNSREFTFTARNDQRSRAIRLSESSGTVAATANSATGGEEGFPGVWYEFRTDNNGLLVLKGFPAFGSPRHAVFDGFTKLSSEPVLGKVLNGTVYPIRNGAVAHLAVESAASPYTFSYEIFSRPANDDIQAAEPITSFPAILDVDLNLASLEDFEFKSPFNFGQRSTAWYLLSPPEKGILTAKTLASDAYPAFGVYGGKRYPVDTPRPDFASGIEGGTNTYFWVAGEAGPGHSAQIACDFILAADNDSFAKGRVLTGRRAKDQVAFFSATREPGEPSASWEVEDGTLWWKWRAESNGIATVRVNHEGFRAKAYTGSNVHQLTELPSLNRLVCSFAARAGELYHIQLVAHQKDTRICWVDLVLESPPANDHFARATPVVSGTQHGWNYGATREFGEPLHASMNGGRSVWYRFDCPGRGVLSASLTGGLTNGILGVYQGSTVRAIKETSGRSARNAFEIVTEPGPYFLVVDGAMGTTEDFDLHLAFQPQALPLSITIHRTGQQLLELTLRGVTAAGAILESSPNLRDWTPSMETTEDNHRLSLPMDPQDPIRFYRLREKRP